MKQNMISHNKPSVGAEEYRAIGRVMRSGWVAEGKEVQEFEAAFCKFFHLKRGHAAAVSSGTAALYAALVSLGVTEGDEVIIPTYLCSAVLNAVFLAKARPVLVDINADDLNISLKGTKAKINSKTKAIIVSHTFGMPADIDEFLKLGVPIIEDCAQAIGAKFKGKYVGAFGNVAITSFYASKMLTTGYGGMVFSKDVRIIDAVRDYRECDCRTAYKPRFNFHMSDMQAAMGRIQLKRFPSFLKKRKDIAERYYRVLPEDTVWPPRMMKPRSSNFFRFLVRTNKAFQFVQFMEKKGIKTTFPIATYELLHRYLKKNPADFPVAEHVAKTSISLPMYPSLSDAEIKKISFAARDFQHG